MLNYKFSKGLLTTVGLLELLPIPDGTLDYWKWKWKKDGNNTYDKGLRLIGKKAFWDPPCRLGSAPASRSAFTTSNLFFRVAFKNAAIILISFLVKARQIPRSGLTKVFHFLFFFWMKTKKGSAPCAVQ